MNFDQGAVLIENRDGAGNADVDADDHFLLPTASLKRAWPKTASRQKPPESPEPIGSTSRRLTSRQFPLRDKIYPAALTAALPVNTRMETVAYSTRAANYETAARLPRKRIVAIFLTSCFVLYLIKFNLLKSTFREAIMQNNHSNGSCASFARGFAAFWAVLAMGLGLIASPAEAAPFAYVANSGSNNVSVIDTATNKAVATVPVGHNPQGIAVTPDGTHAYVTNISDNTVSVIDTASNTVVATILVAPQSVAVTPDGEHVYVTNAGSIDVNGTVAVIAAATNTVVATVPMGNVPAGVAIVPPPPGVPFLAFSATLAIDVDAPKQDAFNLQSQFTCSTVNINPVTAAVKLQVGTFTTTIPPGSFKKQPDGSFTFAAEIGGVTLTALIKPTGTKRYAFNASATRASLTGTKNPVYVTLIIGDDSGATSVNAHISR